MKPITVLRIKAGLWFACLLLVMTPLPILGTTVIMFIVSGRDFAETLLWMKACFWTMLGIPFVGFFIAYLGNSATRTNDEVKDEKALRASIEALREMIKMFTFGLIK